MTDKQGTILLWVISLSIFLVVGMVVGFHQLGYNKGYQEGQINYSLGKIKYAVMDGIKVHFYGFVEKEIKEE